MDDQKTTDDERCAIARAFEARERFWLARGGGLGLGFAPFGFVRAGLCTTPAAATEHDAAATRTDR